MEVMKVRLIDADALMEKYDKTTVWDSWVEINWAPTIDAVPVVRCRDCKYWNEEAEWCSELSFFKTPDGEPCSPAESLDWKSFRADDFCSYGEKKETEGEA